VPVRIAIGARDLENGTAEIARRDTKEKSTQQFDSLITYIPVLLEEMQQNIYNRALTYREEHTTRVDSYEEFKQVLETKGGFVLAHWDGTPETEERIKEETKATIRCIALDTPEEEGVDMLTGKPSTQRVYFARAY
jgi:prolyl-tRNA synthetase